MDTRPGCLSGLLKLLLLDVLFDFLQNKFGFGRRTSCGGCGCGLILFVIFLAFACSILFSTNWTQFSF